MGKRCVTENGLDGGETMERNYYISLTLFYGGRGGGTGTAEYPTISLLHMRDETNKLQRLDTIR